MVEIDESKLVAGGGIVGAFEQATTNVEIRLRVSVTKVTAGQQCRQQTTGGDAYCLPR